MSERTQRSVLAEIRMLIRSVETEKGCAELRRAVGDQLQRLQQRASAQRASKRGPGRPKLSLDSYQRLKILNYLKAGRSVRWIAKRLKFPLSTFARLVAREGLVEEVERIQAIGGLGLVTGGKWQERKRAKAWRRMVQARCPGIVTYSRAVSSIPRRGVVVDIATKEER